MNSQLKPWSSWDCQSLKAESNQFNVNEEKSSEEEQRAQGMLLESLGEEEFKNNYNIDNGEGSESGTESDNDVEEETY